MVTKTEKHFEREIRILRKRVEECEVVETKIKKEEKELSASEAQFRRLFETAKDGILILDAETGIVEDVNPFLTNMLGYSHDQLKGKAVWELGFLKDTIANREKFLELQRREYVRYEDLPLETADGQSRSVEFVSNVYLVGRKKVIQCNIRDITARKKQEKELRDSEETFVNMFQKSPATIILSTPYEGVLLDVNETFLREIGYTRDEVIGRTSAELGLFDDINDRQQLINILKDKGIVSAYECRFRAKSGKILVGLISIGFIKLKGKTCQLSTVIDITKRKRAEEALRESEVRYRRLFESAKDGILILDAETGVVEDVNPFLIDLLGYSIDQFRGKKVWELGFLKDAIANRDKFLELQRREYVRYEDLPLETADGQSRSVEFVSNVYLVGDKKVIQCNIRDITERKRAEEALIRAQKLDSLGVLAGGIAHDFNNIITGVIGNISLVLSDIPTDDKNYEILADAERAAFRTRSLTQQLLTFSKGGAPLKIPTLLSSLLKDAAVFAACGSKAKCRLNVASDLMPVDIDSGQIGQVISNLVINSEQAMPEGGDIIISAENTSLPGKNIVPLEPGRYVAVTIKDSGIGIPESHLKNIFDPYFTTKQAGSGLGLATSYSIIKNHGGYIGVESEVGKGTSFTVYLPAFQGKYDPEAIEPGRKIKKGSGRVLILDDEEIIRVIGMRILAKLGYTAEAFEQSDKALERYLKTWGTEEGFDAVILDLTIPGGKGGQEALAELRQINPKIKAVVSSGYSADPVMAKYKEYGFSASLPKPFSIGQAGEVLYDLLMKADGGADILRVI